MTAQARQVKVSKYAHLDTSQYFVPFKVEASGVLGKAAEEFTQELARCIYKATGEPRSRQFFSSETVCCSPKGKCSSSPRKHGQADRTAGSDLHPIMSTTSYSI